MLNIGEPEVSTKRKSPPAACVIVTLLLAFNTALTLGSTTAAVNAVINALAALAAVTVEPRVNDTVTGAGNVALPIWLAVSVNEYVVLAVNVLDVIIAEVTFNAPVALRP